MGGARDASVTDASLQTDGLAADRGSTPDGTPGTGGRPGSGGRPGTGGATSVGGTTSGTGGSGTGGIDGGGGSTGACIGSALLSSLGKDTVLIGGSMDDETAAKAPFDGRYLYLSGGLFDGSAPCASCATGCTTGGDSCVDGAASGGVAGNGTRTRRGSTPSVSSA